MYQSGNSEVAKIIPITWTIIGIQQLLALFTFCLDCGHKAKLLHRYVRFTGQLTLNGDALFARVFGKTVIDFIVIQKG